MPLDVVAEETRVSRYSKQKGEYAISVALAGVLVLTVVLVRSNWESERLGEVASSAEEFIYRATGIGNSVPDVVGFERLKTYRLGRYRAGVYRAHSAALAFAPGRFIIYNRKGQPVLKLETLEGTKESWTSLFDFSVRQAPALPGSRTNPVYTRNLSGTGLPDILLGQYSGGEHCCTTVTIIELSKDTLRTLGRIDRLTGLPFESLELLKIDRNPAWEIVVRRGYYTHCGGSHDAAEVLSVYAYTGWQYSDQTPRYTDFLENVLQQNHAKWSRGRSRTLQLLQTMAVQYAALGQRGEGERFFAMNLPVVMPELLKNGVDSNVCLEALGSLLDQFSDVPR